MSWTKKALVRNLFRGQAPPREMTSGYRAMWLIVVFDLPVGTSSERRAATHFRKRLLDEGFVMKQWSVYMRYFENRSRAEAAAERLGKKVPSMGHVSMMFLTDKQFGLTRNFYGKAREGPDEKPAQLALF